MADDSTASIITLVQPAASPRAAPLTPAQRAKRYRDKKRGKAPVDIKVNHSVPVDRPARNSVPRQPAIVTVTEPNPVTRVTVIPVTAVPSPSPPSRYGVTSILLATAGLGLAAMGLTINGWYARSLGSTDVSGWLFLGIGLAADLAAIAIPSAAAARWRAGRRGEAAAGWAIWTMALLFAVTAGIGFASVNISDVTASRASRASPAVTQAEASLRDAMSTRDRECVSGNGKICRQREDAVEERRKALDVAQRAIEQAADPQTEAAIKMVAWLSLGKLAPSHHDFALMRLLLIALLPQLGGVLLMLARRK